VSPRIKVFLQYVFLLSVTVLLVWFSLRGLNQADPNDPTSAWEKLETAWTTADKAWLIAMAGVAFASHFIRAIRWKMLIEPSGHEVKTSHSFYSLMVGYLVNLVIPRGGEVSRCYNLYRLNKTPVDISFGTVVTERIIDVVCLLLLIIISFVYESRKLFEFIDTLPLKFEFKGTSLIILAAVVALVVALILIPVYVLKPNSKARRFLEKTFIGFKAGLLSVFRLRKPVLFIIYSILVWLLYFVMTYTVMQAFPATEDLGMGAVLSLFAIGAIAMAAPLPGGAGSYHVLVPQGLVFLYAIDLPDAVAFTVIFHGWQTLMMIVGGAVSLLITTAIVRKTKPLR
jgi:glycosyltransferase 2 family protein